ncbi:MAG: hypothetical protein OHK0053_09950 [Microscillaceae bacterium]
MPYFIIYVPFMKVAGMALFPFILVNERHYRHDKVLINHERIHLAQQAETLVLPFYLLYLCNYLFNLLRYRHHHRAYRRLYFEKEAYEHETDLHYLQKRPFWAFLKYVRA